MKVLFSIVTLFMVISLSAPQQAHAQQTLYGLPARMRDLSDLELTDTNTLTPPQKTEVILSWLVEERNHPSPTTQGTGGSPIDSDYLQAQIVKDLEVWGDPNAVGWVLSSTSLKDEGLRDIMVLVLGSMGDRSQLPKIESIMQDNPNPYLRAIAAEDLGLLGSVSSIPVLEKAAKDPFFLTFASESHGGKVIDFYPVRQVAGETLKVLRDPDALKLKMERNQFFVQRLNNARLYAHQHNLKPERFTKIADRSRATPKSPKA